MAHVNATPGTEEFTLLKLREEAGEVATAASDDLMIAEVTDVLGALAICEDPIFHSRLHDAIEEMALRQSRRGRTSPLHQRMIDRVRYALRALTQIAPRMTTPLVTNTEERPQ